MPKHRVLALVSLLLLTACAANPPKPEESASPGTGQSELQPPASDNAEALYTYAQALEGKGQEQEAMAYYLQATQVDPEHLASHIALAQLYTKFKRTEEAKIAFENVLRLDRNHAFVAQYKEARLKFYSAMNIAQNEEYDKALKLLSEAPRNTPLDTEIEAKTKEWQDMLKGSSQVRQTQDLIEQASLLAYQGKYQQAIDLINTAPDASSNSSIQEKVKQWQQAMKSAPPPEAQVTPPPVGNKNMLFVVGDKVNLRQSPYLYAESLATLANGSSVELLLDKGYEADGYQWSKVKTADGKIGWVAANLLRNSLSAPPTTRPTPLPTQPDTRPDTTPAATYGTKYIKGNHVNVRRSPTTSGTLVTQAMDGASVIVLSERNLKADGYEWTKVKLGDGQIGWVASTFLRGPQAQPPATPPKQPVAQAPKVRVAYVTAQNVNLRAAPSTTAEVVTMVSAPEKVTLLDTKPVKQGNYVWQQIQTSSGKKGWLVTQFLGSAKPQAMASSVRHIRGDKVNIRKTPSLKAAVLITAEEGTAVTLVDSKAVKQEGYSWYKIKLADGRIGWVASDFIGR